MKTPNWLKIAVAGFTCWMANAETNYDWSDLARAGRIENGEVISEGGRNVLRIVNTNAAPKQFPLLKIENPPIGGKVYAIRGEIQYKNVAGQSYLEMWNSFPGTAPGAPEQKYFTRTLGSNGEMAVISGSSGWREFALPFDGRAAPSKPTRLEVNLVMAGAGTVKIGALQLEDLTASTFATGSDGKPAWWSNRAGGLIGGAAGAILGCLASALTWCASKGKARDFVLVTSKIMIGLGVFALALALAAVSIHQPFWVWYGPALVGILLLAILPGRYRIYQKQYAEVELRRMQAVDLGKVSAGN